MKRQCDPLPATFPIELCESVRIMYRLLNFTNLLDLQRRTGLRFRTELAEVLVDRSAAATAMEDAREGLSTARHDHVPSVVELRVED